MSWENLHYCKYFCCLIFLSSCLFICCTLCFSFGLMKRVIHDLCCVGFDKIFGIISFCIWMILMLGWMWIKQFGFWMLLNLIGCWIFNNHFCVQLARPEIHACHVDDSNITYYGSFDGSLFIFVVNFFKNRII